MIQITVPYSVTNVILYVVDKRAKKMLLINDLERKCRERQPTQAPAIR